jgi:hypothetical protein
MVSQGSNTPFLSLSVEASALSTSTEMAGQIFSVPEEVTLSIRQWLVYLVNYFETLAPRLPNQA